MKMTFRTITCAIMIACLASVAGAALTTNYFITAGGELTNSANWSDGNLPLATNGYVGVVNNMNANTTNTPSGAYLGLNLIFQGTSQTTGKINNQQTIDKTVVLMDNAKIYCPSEFRVSGTVTIMNTSTQHSGKDLRIYSGGLIDVYDNGNLHSSRSIAISSNGTVRLNDSAKMTADLGSGTTTDWVLNISAGGHLDFTSTNAVFQQIRFDTTATLIQMIEDGRITKNGAAATTNDFSVTYTDTGVASTSFTTLQMIPEPATIGLMGVASAALFFLRKKMRR